MVSSIDRLFAAHRAVLRARATQGGIDPLAVTASTVRTWATFAKASAEAERSLALAPAPGPVAQVAHAAVALEHANKLRGWPGDGPADPGLRAATRAMIDVARLSQSENSNREARGEALTILRSAVWVAAETVTHAARRHAQELRIEHGTAAPSATLDATTDSARRVGSSAQLMAARRTDHGVSDLQQQELSALGAWDVAAHRAMLANRSTATLHVVSTLEAAIASGLVDAIGAATTTGAIDQLTAERVDPWLRTARDRWARIAEAMTELSFGSMPVPGELVSAGREVRRGLDRLDALGQTEPAQTAALLVGHLATSASLAATARDLCAEDLLRAPAPAVNRLIREDEDRMGAVVSPIDVQRKVSIPLPEPLRTSLVSDLDAAAKSMDLSVQSSAGLADHQSVGRFAQRRPDLASSAPVASGSVKLLAHHAPSGLLI